MLGTDGLLYVADVGDASHQVELLARPRTGREILAPVWGPGGDWLAWSESDGVDGRVRVMTPTGEGVLEQAGFPAFCLDPSPDGQYLAQLSTGPLGLELTVIELATGATTLVARGAPLYWAWAPGARRLAVHVHRRLFIAHIGAMDGAVIEYDLLDDVDRFLAPWWSPGAGELVAVDDQQRLVAISFDDDERTPVAAGQSGYRFAVDAAGQRVALVSQHHDGAVVDVVDRLTGERVTAVDEPVAGMWWSPDGTALGSLVRAGGADEPLVRWNVWRGGDASQNFLSAPFQPSRVVAETVLPFFEQFAFAHHFWSPASQRLVMPGVMRGGRNEVFVHEPGAGAPRSITDGTLAWWAPARRDDDG